MNTESAYKLYTALRLHFTTDNYDIRNGVPPKSPKSGVKEKFGKHLQKMMKTYNYNEDAFMGYLVANFLNGSEWGALYEPQGHEVYLEWQKIQDSLTYTYKQDVEYLASQVVNVEDSWDCSSGHPVILKAYCGKKCRLETLVILNKLYRFITVVDEQLVLDPVWTSVSRTIYKYSPFIKIDKDKFSMITSKAFYA